MKDVKAFLKIKRTAGEYRPVCERIKDYKEVTILRSDAKSQEQASRCMDCGTPFCHWACPIGNYIPEWNEAVLFSHWEKAFNLLNATNNMPEITGRLCSAVCEYACVLGINDDPVTIRENELAIIEYGFKEGLIKPQPPKKRSGKKVAIIGSGPAGLAAAAQLNYAGHKVVVFEKDDKIGGILRYGIPDFKLKKGIIERRLDIWRKEGIEFKTKANAGADYPPAKLLKEFDALCLAIGSRTPRDLRIPGRGLKGIHFAMDYLAQSNKRVAGEKISHKDLIDAKDKKVVVIGGGDTGSDCVGTAHRQGAACVVQIELLEKPLECRTEDYPWPLYPMILKASTSHEEGGQRRWSVLTKKFIGDKGKVKKLSCVQVEFINKPQATLLRQGFGGQASHKPQVKSCPVMKEIAGSEFEIDADLVILAVGFLHPQHNGIVRELNLSLDKRGNIEVGEDFMTSKKGVFCAGDARRGQSLIVWAISEGRRAARAIDEYLMGESNLPLF